jgi:hypothetical protein
MANIEHKMTEKESLELITSMINQAKEKVNESGTLYLLWGWLILFCCIVQFVGVEFFNDSNVYLVWLLTWVVLIVQVFYLWRKRKRIRVKTYMREVNAYVWLVFFISLMLLFFIESRFNAYKVFNPLLLMMYGMPTFLSGIILKFKPLVIGGICCWILSIIAVFTPIDYQVLLVGLSIISGWIIPGYILRSTSKATIPKSIRDEKLFV